MRILVVNAGSSSIKLRLLDPGDELLGREDLEALPGGRDLRAAVERLGPADAVGHRIVHGGTGFREPTIVDAEVEAALRELTELAPLHQPAALEALDAVREILPEVPAVACFDTAFHSTLPDAAATYAVPEEWRKGHGVRRYGFHGLSHAYASRRAAELLESDDLRLVSCHLGAGASLAAVNAGRCVDTTMGFTPLEGLVMATRSGSIDPGLVLWLLEHLDLSAESLAEALEHRSGVLALAGTADLRQVSAAAEAGEPRARLALDVYLHRLRGAIASMAAALGGIDALLFTAGVGEHAASIRAGAAKGLDFLGIDLDPERNATAEPDAEISSRDSRVRVLVLETREDLEIARLVREVL